MPTIDGYSAVNNVRATISDVESVGALVDLAIQSGANRMVRASAQQPVTVRFALGSGDSPR